MAPPAGARKAEGRNWAPSSFPGTPCSLFIFFVEYIDFFRILINTICQAVVGNSSASGGKIFGSGVCGRTTDGRVQRLF
jgi:hypothetical protein